MSTGAAIAQVVTWSLVIFGWLIISGQHNKRETRKEIRSRIDGIRERLIHLEKLSFEYHTVEPSDSKSREIKLLIQRVWLDAIRLKIIDENDLGAFLTELRKAITLNNFDTSNYKQLTPDAEQIADIGHSIMTFESALENAYASKYL